MKTSGVTPLVEEQGTGAGIRISGGHRENKVTGDTDWQTLSYDFEVLEPARDVELVAELRAEAGQAWFEPVLTLRRIPSD